MKGDNRILQTARYLGLSGASLALFLSFILMVISPFLLPIYGFSLKAILKGIEINFSPHDLPLLIIIISFLFFGNILPLILLYSAMRKLALLYDNFHISTYYGLSVLTFFLPIASYLFRASALKTLAGLIKNKWFLRASKLYFWAGIISFFSLISFEFQNFSIRGIADFLLFVLSFIGLLSEFFGFYELLTVLPQPLETAEL